MKHLYFFALIFLLCAFSSAKAVEWSSEYQINAKAEVSENKRLRVRNEEDDFGAILDSSGWLHARTERNETKVRGRLVLKEYDEDDTLDSDDIYFDFDNRYMWERAAANFNAGYSRVNTVFSELEDSGFVVVSEKDRREEIYVNPSFEYMFSEADIFSVGFYYSDVDFPGSDPISLSSYEYWNANVGWSHALTERLALISSMFYSEFDSDNFNSETESVGINAGVEYAFSETFTTRFTAGYQDSDFEDTNGGVRTTGSEDGYLLELNIDKEFYTSRINFLLGRSLVPSSSGVVNQQNELRFNYIKDWQHNLFSVFDFVALDNESLDSDADFNDREYFRGKLELGWQFTPHWSISTQYYYTWQEYDRTDDSADDNTIALNLRFRSLRKTLFK